MNKMNNKFLLLPLVVMMSACEVQENTDNEVAATVVPTPTQIPATVTISDVVAFTPADSSVLIIDSQQAYIANSDDFWGKEWYPDLVMPAENVDPDINAKISRIASLAKQAKDSGLQANITYEQFVSEEWGNSHSPFIEEIYAELPEGTSEFFKGNFNTTLEDDFKAAMQALLDAGKTKIIVSGAETDVCVMQTSLGLKAMGFDVYFASDATFSTEFYNRHTFKRLQQAGIKLATTAELLESMQASDELVYSPRYAIDERESLHQGDRHQMVSINFNMDDTNLAKGEHDNKAAVAVRQESWAAELYYLFAPAGATAMPNYHVSADMSAMSATILQPETLQTYSAIDGVINDMLTLDKTQAVITGVIGEEQLLNAVTKLMAEGITPIIMEDNLLGTEVDPIHYLDKAYQLGAVPSSQKSTGYEMYVRIQLKDFSEGEVAGYWNRIDSGDGGVIPEYFPRLR